MVSTFTRKFTVCTTPDQFQFTFYCDKCGRPWNSRSILSLENPCKSGKETGIRETAYRAAFHAAFAEAKKEGMAFFNQCERCGFWVCNEHYSEENNLCLNCKEKGE